MTTVDLTGIAIEKMTAVELRKLGAQVGIKGASKGKKEFLMGTLMTLRHEQLRLAEEAAKAEAEAKPKATAKRTAKICRICETRPVGIGVGDDRESAKSLEECNPCYTLGGWENSHSDNDHEGVLAGEVKYGQTTHKTEAEFENWLAYEKSEAENCWVCHPELDATRTEYKPRHSGTSRAGMRMTVRRGDAAQTKAKVILDAAEARGAKIGYVGSPERAGVYLVNVLVGTHDFHLQWDLAGRFLYGPSKVTVAGKTRKIRNVSEALKLIG